MANFIDPKRIEAAAERLTVSIEEPITRCRVHRLLCNTFRDDPSCARLPTPRQLAAAPAWVAERRALGEAVHVFRLSARARTSAMRLVTLVRTAVAPFEARAGLEHLFAAEQRVFIAKSIRMSAPDMERAAAELAQTRAEIDEDRRFASEIYAAETIPASGERSWSIVQRPIDLTKVGEVLQNCLRRRSGYFTGYAREMQSGAATFWVLRDGGAIVAVARAKQNLVVDFKGRGNAPPGPYLKDLRFLLDAKGYTSPVDWFGVRITLDARAAAWFSEAA